MSIKQRSDMSPLKLAWAAQQLAPKLALVDAEPIAIVGMGCRFPGAADPAALWQLLLEGGDTITEVPADRWDVDAYYDPDPLAPGKTNIRHGGFLDQISMFDPLFFDISPREALTLDPQHRLLLEVSWEALENAGIPPSTLFNSPTGVFAGINWSDYYDLCASAEFDVFAHNEYLTHLGFGTPLCIAAGRVSYVLGLTGPNMAIDTACSASLVTVHLACQSLRRRECNLALAGGVNAILLPDTHIIFAKTHMLSPDGRCKSFDASADGYVRSEGCGMLVLKRLSDAVADGDTIMALIRGSAINNDGRSSGLTAPNGSAQRAVIRQALENAGVAPEQVSYVDAHGTGTTLGDPIEAGALGAVYNENRTQPLLIGSIKTNIGHVEAAAGVAGLIKLVLSLQHGEIPASLHFQQPNPLIDWDELALKVVTERTAWPAGRRLASTSGFGVSGTNAHVVLEEAPVLETPPATAQRPMHVLPLSAKTGGALAELATRYTTHLAHETDASLHDICYTASVGRMHFRHRLAVVADDKAGMLKKLEAYLADPEIQGQPARALAGEAPKIAFLFTGQGSQYVGMGRELYETQPVFRATLDRCAEILRAYLDKPLLEVMYPADSEQADVGSTLLDQTGYTQPALFALEYSLAELWKSWGILPNLVVGHSVGEYVAACVAGVFSLEDGLKLIARRGQLMQALPQTGDMVAVRAGEAQVSAIIEPWAQMVSFAAVNGPQSTVISGERQAISTLVKKLHAADIKTQPLAVSHAFHSPLMEPMLAEFADVARTITYHAPSIPVVSNLTGRLASGLRQTLPTNTERDEVPLTHWQYWVRHVRQAVRFADGIMTLEQLGCNTFIEIGPKPILTGMGQECLATENATWLPSLRPGRTDWQQMLESLADVYRCGVDVDWKGFTREYAQRKVSIPTYPFQRQRYWLPDVLHKKRQTRTTLRPLIDTMIQSPLVKEIIMETVLSPERLPYLADYRLIDTPVAPAACHLALVLSGAELLGMPACQLDGVVFPTVLALPEDKACTVQLVFTPHGITPPPPSASFQLISLTAGATLASPICHASGHVTQQNPNALPMVDLSACQQRCSDMVEPDELYTAASAQGIGTGSRFQWFDRVWRGPGEALARLTPPADSGSMDGYWLHPGLVDACFQLCAATQTTTRQELRVPAAIQRLHVVSAPAVQGWWCHVQQIGDEQWDIALLDQTGQTIALFHKVETQLAPPSLRLRRQINDWLYRIDWHAQPLETQPVKTDVTTDAAGRWLIVTDTAEAGAALETHLQAQGQPCLCVRVGSNDASDNVGQMIVNPHNPDDFHRLIATHLGDERDDQPPCRGVIYLCDVEPACADISPPAAVQTLSEAALHLVQSLISASLAPRLYLVTRGSQAVSGAEPVAVASAAVWGLGRTLVLEHPELRCTCVDLDRTDDMQAAVTALCAELDASDTESQVAFRAGVRYVARLVRYVAPPVFSPHSVDGESQESSYLIMHGVDGLGLKMVQSLVEQGARHLVLAGYDRITPQARTAALALEAAGASITLMQVDASKCESIQTALEACQMHAPLRGIVYMVGTQRDKWVQQESADSFTAVVAPVVQGAWHIHQLTTHLPLDFFICCSSVASLLGGTAQGSQAVANAFLDALMHQRRSLGLAGLSINWGDWADVDGSLPGNQVGMQQMAVKESVLIVGELLRADNQPNTAQIGMLQATWPELRKQWPFVGIPPFISHLLQQEQRMKPTVVADNILRQVREAAAAEREQILQTYLQEQVAQVMNLDPGYAFLPQQCWHELGIDSLMSVELKNRLTRQLKVTVPLDAILQGGSTQKIAQLVLNLLDNALKDTVTQ